MWKKRQKGGWAKWNGKKVKSFPCCLMKWSPLPFCGDVSTVKKAFKTEHNIIPTIWASWQRIAKCYAKAQSWQTTYRDNKRENKPWSTNSTLCRTIQGGESPLFGCPCRINRLWRSKQCYQQHQAINQRPSIIDHKFDTLRQWTCLKQFTNWCKIKQDIHSPHENKLSPQCNDAPHPLYSCLAATMVQSYLKLAVTKARVCMLCIYIPAQHLYPLHSIYIPCATPILLNNNSPDKQVHFSMVWGSPINNNQLLTHLLCLYKERDGD